MEVSNVVVLFCLRVPITNATLLNVLKHEIGSLLSLRSKREISDDKMGIEESPALSIATSREKVLGLALHNDVTALPEALHQILDSDALVGALRCIPEAWNLENQDGLLICLCDIYCWAIKGHFSPEVQKIAIEGLCNILDAGIKAPYTGGMAAINTIIALKPVSDAITSSPGVANLWTELSGWLAVFEIIKLSDGVDNLQDVINTAPALRYWSRVWAFLGTESQVSTVSNRVWALLIILGL